MSTSQSHPPKDSGTKAPAVTPAKASQSDRQAAALRDNLKRRKAQARARGEPASERDKGGHEG